MSTLDVNVILKCFMAENEYDFNFNDKTNLLEVFDSMEVVRLLMFTEEYLIDNFNIMVQLADEHTFDVSSSPLLSVENWCKFVDQQIEN